ncbi:MAG: aspartyl protease family protein [Gemmatimonadota bacterium]|nr:aspartyl protease family protein [Gemmatimonadota bacterium]
MLGVLHGVQGCTLIFGRGTADAVSIVQGTAPSDVRRDTTDTPFAASLDRVSWRGREGPASSGRAFWTDVGVLDIASAEQDAVGLDERTFATALRHLMASDPQGAAIAFHALQKTASDTLVRTRARDGLTMALRWYSDWATIAGLQPDSAVSPLTGTRPDHGAVERWARTFALINPPAVSFSDASIVLPLRRSRIGTPIVRVLVNGRAHEFWLDTGASMTVLGSDVAVAAGVRFAANDTLALGVVGGSIDARAGLIDSVSLGGFTARGVAAAIVDTRTLRLDYRLENGQDVAVPIDGVIGVDLLRWMDVTIDVRAGTISIARPRHDAGIMRNLFWVGFPVVRLITRDGQPLVFGLDTGAQETYVTLGLLRKLPRTHVALRRGELGGLGGREAHTEWVATDLEVSDGTYAIKLHNAPIGPDRPSSFVNFDGMIGSDVALNTRLHLDFENGVFDVRPSAAANPLRRGAGSGTQPSGPSLLQTLWPANPQSSGKHSINRRVQDAISP